MKNLVAEKLGGALKQVERLGAILFFFLGLLISIIVSVDNISNYEKIIWGIFITIASLLLAICFKKPKVHYNTFLLVWLISGVLIYSYFHFPMINNFVDDTYYSFAHNEQDVILLLPDFDNATENNQDGRIFSEEIFHQLKSTIIDEMKNSLKEILPGKKFNIKIDRITEVLSKDEIYNRGKKRLDDFGFYGKLLKYYKNGEKIYYIKDFSAIIINPKLEAIINKPKESKFRYSNIKLLTEKVCIPFDEITKISVNLGLYEIAAKENEKVRNEIYKLIDKNFLDITETIFNNPIIVSYVKATRLYNNVLENNKYISTRESISKLDSAKYYYNKVIELLNNKKNENLPNFTLSRIYSNLGDTYKEMHKLDGNTEYLHLADSAYYKAAKLN
jgi:hypothetical protein